MECSEELLRPVMTAQKVEVIISMFLIILLVQILVDTLQQGHIKFDVMVNIYFPKHHSWHSISILRPPTVNTRTPTPLLTFQVRDASKSTYKDLKKIEFTQLFLFLPSSCHSKSKLYCGPKSPTASIFYGIWIIQSDAMVFKLNLDKISLKKLFPTMNI